MGHLSFFSLYISIDRSSSPSRSTKGDQKAKGSKKEENEGKEVKISQIKEKEEKGETQ